MPENGSHSGTGHKEGNAPHQIDLSVPVRCHISGTVRIHQCDAEPEARALFPDGFPGKEEFINGFLFRLHSPDGGIQLLSADPVELLIRGRPIME